MKKAIRALFVGTFAMLIILSNTLTCFAHPQASDHNKELEAVLFEDGYSKYKSDEIKNNIQAIEYASYLTIDQFGGYGENQYNNLGVKSIIR